MMSIRHVEADGREKVHEVDSVNRTREGKLVFLKEETIETGKVYVMNSEGKTIATYDFDKQKQS